MGILKFLRLTLMFGSIVVDSKSMVSEEDALNYLEDFGYVKSSDEHGFMSSSAGSVSEAVKSFQVSL